MTLAGRFIIDRTGDERIAAQSVEDCMTILDELNLQAAIEDPELVVVGHRESGAALTFGLGLNESVLCWQGASGDPPYLSTRVMIHAKARHGFCSIKFQPTSKTTT